ncbi:hypothetical protein [Streptomyces sp. CBMA152]|uniref:hypothetical protein n=1 Tax=Streptomyces sp. CBMA152 TaxID=1896312 RepID=UPI0016614EA2|nr:hypothetical protein [Streptomyces sp. CBMA152]MBD0740887.1 hypothetical protein [Streptomyces sp. CBMA152]
MTQVTAWGRPVYAPALYPRRFRPAVVKFEECVITGHTLPTSTPSPPPSAIDELARRHVAFLPAEAPQRLPEQRAWAADVATGHDGGVRISLHGGGNTTQLAASHNRITAAAGVRIGNAGQPRPGL